ncbi:hypothetical protein HJG60_009496 [Phyllostomus discolor]|uniref:Uncharacterized protein n=1 Tax=Phyllostomus discolor TaxID=89673 RepID=A0A833YJU6_9CHIR|nr:hypothetical protein HJG60_009496 [Phyllostomus discolor]
MGRSSQCGRFCSVGFCALILLTTSPPLPAPSLSTLCSSPVIVSVPNVHNVVHHIARGAAARDPGHGSRGPKDSLERKEAAAPSGHGGAGPRPAAAPGSTSRVKRKAADARAPRTEENTTRSILEEADDRKTNFYLVFIRRKED